jgi:signal transduction histidine kinase
MAEPLRLLLVDDDEVDRLAVTRLLRRTHFDAAVHECTDPASALAAAGSGGFDCVLLDYNLPGIDGLSLLRELRARSETVPVIALTGQGGEEVAVELMKAGAADYINKNTLSLERLERSLRYALALHRSEEERRLLLQREQRAREEAQAANRAKDEFLATLSHELRTPLNAILGWSRLLVGGNLDAGTARRAIEIIDRNTRLQAQLIEDLLDISRIITGKLRLNVQQIDPIHVVEAAVDSVKPAAEAKDIRLQIVLDPQAGPIMGDPDRLQQICWNLLSNALKFTPKKGRIQVILERIDSSVELTVADSGAGIAPEFLPYVFERFRQQDTSITRRFGGLGLGLSIVKSLAELHGGSVRVQSEGEGRGATFVVRLPRALVKAAPTDRPFSSASLPTVGSADCPPGIEGLRVVIVDDEPDALEMLVVMLEQCGAKVKAVHTAAEGFEAVQSIRPDVLISDIGMPDEDGYRLIQRVRELPPSAGGRTPAIALTAFARAEDRTRALRVGFQTHVVKPVEPAELLAVVASLMERFSEAKG